MVVTQVEVSGGYSSHAPFSLGGEGLSFVVTGCRDDDLVSVFVNGTCGGSSQLTLFFCLFLYLCYLLSLLRGSTDLHTQDNVTYL